MATAGAIKAGRAFVELFADSTELEKGLRMAANALADFGNQCRGIGSAITRAMSVPLGAVAKSTTDFAAFDDRMREVQAKSQSTGEEFKRLTEKAKELGRTTSFTADQVAGAMAVMAQGGFKADAIETCIADVMNLSRATGTDLPRAAEIAMQAINSFQLPKSDIGRVVDVMTATANVSAISLEDLGETFKYVATNTNLAGFSIETLCKNIGALGNVGVKGSMAGTSLRNILTRMADPKVQEIYRKHGVEVKDKKGDFRSLPSIFEELQSKSKNMGKTEQLALFDQLFGKRALAAGASLTAISSPGVDAGIDNSKGTAAKTSKEMDAGIGGSFRMLTSAAEGLRLAIGDSLTPEITKLAKVFTAVVTKITEFVKQHKELVVVLTAITAGVAAFGAGLTALGIAFTAASTSIKAFITVYKTATIAVTGAKAIWGGLSLAFANTGRAIGVMNLGMKNFALLAGAGAILALPGILKQVATYTAECTNEFQNAYNSLDKKGRPVESLSEEERAKELQAVMDAIGELNRNNSELQKDAKSRAGTWANAGTGQYWTGGQEDANTRQQKHISETGKQIIANNKTIRELQARADQLRNGMTAPPTADKATPAKPLKPGEGPGEWVRSDDPADQVIDENHPMPGHKWVPQPAKEVAPPTGDKTTTAKPAKEKSDLPNIPDVADLDDMVNKVTETSGAKAAQIRGLLPDNYRVAESLKLLTALGDKGSGEINKKPVLDQLLAVVIQQLARLTSIDRNTAQPQDYDYL